VSRVITSPIKRFPGTVILSDPLTFPQTFEFEDSLRSVNDIRESGDITRLRYALLPGVLACIEEWHLNSGFPERPALDNFPSTPRQSVAQLIDWLVEEISALYRESDDVPLA
jgi:hypothetical protein